jgi:hypothetical protein
MTLYVLERWLARLTASPHDGTFVLKGGVLLAALDARRPTADADLLALHLSNDEEVVRARVAQICRVNLDDDDGVEYLAERSPHGPSGTMISTQASESASIAACPQQR